MPTRRFVAPALYVAGSGVLADSATFDGIEADRALVCGGEAALAAAGDPLRDGLADAGIDEVATVAGVDTCTDARIDSLTDRIRSADAGVVVGVGGGVAIDASKAAATREATELAVVPTIASTDAPTSSVAVVYEESGGFAGYVHRTRNPEVVAVDLDLIAAAPVRFLRYGMGDAFATRFEAEAVRRAGTTTHAGGLPTDAALALARQCYETLDAHGERALESVACDAVTPALEHVAETAVLQSGLGFENGGLAAAHAYSKGFTRAGVSAPHGALVALGTLAQLLLTDRDPSVLGDALAVYDRLDLGAPLADLSLGRDRLDAVGGHACAADTTMDALARDVTPSQATDALQVATRLADLW